MKILLPLDENKKDVCVSFARAPFFMIYDTSTSQSDILVNNAADANSGAGTKAAQFALDMGADAVITVRLGQNSADVLKLGQVKIYKSCVNDALENIKALEQDKLNLLDHFHAGFHGVR